MLDAALGYTSVVMAVMVNAALGVVWPPRRLAWVEVALLLRWPACARPGGSERGWANSAVGRGISRPWGPST